jgi:hypothetical protein
MYNLVLTKASAIAAKVGDDFISKIKIIIILLRIIIFISINYTIIMAINEVRVFMIIVMTRNEANDKAAKLLAFKDEVICHYPFFNLDEATTDDTLILIDLSADGQFQDFDPKDLSIALISKGLPKSIKKILLMVSDISPSVGELHNKSILDFAEGIEKTLYSKYYSVQVHCLSNHIFGSMLIIPPSDENPNWEIYKLNYNLSKQSLTNGPESIAEIKEKTLIGSTPNIREWLSDKKNVSVISRPPHPAIALFAAKSRREEILEKQTVLNIQEMPASQVTYIKELSHLQPVERLKVLESFAKEVEKLGISLSVSIKPNVSAQK